MRIVPSGGPAIGAPVVAPVPPAVDASDASRGSAGAASSTGVPAVAPPAAASADAGFEEFEFPRLPPRRKPSVFMSVVVPALLVAVAVWLSGVLDTAWLQCIPLVGVFVRSGLSGVDPDAGAEHAAVRPWTDGIARWLALVALALFAFR